MTPVSAAGQEPAELYLDLMKKCLTRYGFGGAYRELRPRQGAKALLVRLAAQLLARRQLALVTSLPFDPKVREEGLDWPPEAETMIGLRRLNNLHDCIRDVIREDIPGDFIETGVWRGGATIFMRAALAAYGDPHRRVWVADSFAGLPKPEADRAPVDAGDISWTRGILAVSVDEVKANFERYGLLDERVQFLVGWFKDTLPSAPVNQLAVARLDGDMYASTMDALVALYPKLSPGGYLIVDDYNLPGCKAAVDDYREQHAIHEPIQRVDWTGVYWRRER